MKTLKIGLVFLVLAIVGGIGFIGVGGLSVEAREEALGKIRVDMGYYASVQEEVIDIAGVDSFKLDSINARVTITEGETLECKIFSVFEGEFSHTLDNGVFSLKQASMPSNSKSWLRYIIPYYNLVQTSRVNLTVPSGIEVVIDINSSSGAVVIEDISASSIDLDISSGMTVFTNIESQSIDVSYSSGRFSFSSVTADSIIVTGSSGAFIANSVTAGSLEVAVGSGGVTLDSVECETLSVEVDSDGIDLNNITADNVVVSAKSGSARINRAVVSDLTADVSSGALRLDLVTAVSIVASCESGSVRFNGVFAESYDLQARSGALLINLLGSEENYQLDLKAESGSIKVNNRYDFSKNEGAENTIKARSGSGRIRITFRDDTPYHH